MDSENSSEAGEAGSILSSDEFFDVVENPEQTESTDIEEDQEFYSEEDNISSRPSLCKMMALLCTRLPTLYVYASACYWCYHFEVSS